MSQIHVNDKKFSINSPMKGKQQLKTTDDLVNNMKSALVLFSLFVTGLQVNFLLKVIEKILFTNLKGCSTW